MCSRVPEGYQGDSGLGMYTRSSRVSLGVTLTPHPSDTVPLCSKHRKVRPDTQPMKQNRKKQAWRMFESQLVIDTPYLTPVGPIHRTSRPARESVGPSHLDFIRLNRSCYHRRRSISTNVAISTPMDFRWRRTRGGLAALSQRGRREPNEMRQELWCESCQFRRLCVRNVFREMTVAFLVSSGCTTDG